MGPRTREESESVSIQNVVFTEDGIDYSIDGDQWCATLPDFTNLQESPAGFGYDKESARLDLERQESA
jgi:hypothetical protein